GDGGFENGRFEEQFQLGDLGFDGAVKDVGGSAAAEPTPVLQSIQRLLQILHFGAALPDVGREGVELAFGDIVLGGGDQVRLKQFKGANVFIGDNDPVSPVVGLGDPIVEKLLAKFLVGLFALIQVHQHALAKDFNVRLGGGHLGPKQFRLGVDQDPD